MVRYSDTFLLLLANLVRTMLSAVIPIVSMIALSYIHDTTMRLLAVTMFTMLFSLLLKAVTDARTVEVFVVGAA